ncbi:DUF6382 domain-containing protein [Paenibacillus glacialis]|uniref:FHA domain-containing protein n=1 Tax=Paenibacillus glacialis TaxID=494026 RepID=A0A168NW85_9BACL|nr:DUF6382 domain-containing protein [Paenibacillus glacialis]OAB46157.1 hypothetical protein PGLA_01835 [Paenibacillus glacialis]
MFGLTRDFIQSGGNYMILSSPEGIPSSELSRVQTSMISAAKIPHLLPLTMKELDFKVSLQYDITNTKMLTHSLKSDKLTLDEYYGLLLQIVSALDDSKLYMLDQDQYILQEDYIFMEGPLHSGTLYLTYIPIQSMKNSTTIQSSLHHLITRLMTSVSELQGNGIQTLLQYVSVEEFTLTGLKGLLLNLMAGAGQSLHSQHVHNNIHQSDLHQTNIHQHNIELPQIFQTNSISSSVPKSIPRATEPERKVRLSADSQDMSDHHPAVPRKREPIIKTPAKTSFDKEHTWMNDYHEDDMADGDEEHKSSPTKTYVALSCLVTCAVAWRFLYMSHPGTVMLSVCILVTAVLGAIAWLGWKGKLGLPRKRVDSLTESVPLFDSGRLDDTHRKRGSSFQVERLTGFFGGSSKEKELEPSEKRWVFPDNPTPERTQADWGIMNRESAATSMNDEEEQGDYYAQLGHKTEMLTSPRVNATVLLKPENNTSQDVQFTSYKSYPYLERREIGQGIQKGLHRGNSAQSELAATPIVLNLPHFIIGRAADVAQFVEETPGTSRAHVELSKGSGGYVIKDLGSKNGTLLNKEPMVSYKEYPLHDGDTFTIIKGEYTYHLRS